MIAEHDVPAIFAERLGSTGDAEALADRIGVTVVELDSDSLAPDGPAVVLHRPAARQRGGDRRRV